MAPQKKITVSEAHQWLKNLDQSKTRGLSSGDEDTWLEFINGLRPVDFVEPKKSRKPRVSKRSSGSSDISERSAEGYDPMRCDARASKKKNGLRFDFQCFHAKLDDQCYCKNHLRQLNSSKGLELGKFNEERPDQWADGKAIAWHDSDPTLLDSLKESSKKKKVKTDSDGPKKTKNCGLCGAVGHNRRKCPTLDKTPEEHSDGDTYEENGIVNQVCIQKHIKPDGTECEVEIHTPVDLCQVCPGPNPENEAEAARLDRIAKLEAEADLEAEPETEPDDDLELIPQLPKDNGVGTGLIPLEFDDSVTEDMSDVDSDSDEDEENVPFLFQGVQYEREPNGDKTVFDDDGDTIGTWDGESIVFIGGVEERQHKKRVAELGESTPQSTSSEDLLSLAVGELRKMAKSLNISQDDLDSAFDTENPKEKIIQLIRSV
jgi:hypothetical protein